MNTQYFPHFIRANYPVLTNEPNELLIELGEAFKQYMSELFEGKMDNLEPIWNIDSRTIVMNKVNQIPFLVNGYHPALIIHFEQFFTKMKKESENAQTT